MYTGAAMVREVVLFMLEYSLGSGAYVPISLLFTQERGLQTWDETADRIILARVPFS